MLSKIIQSYLFFFCYSHCKNKSNNCVCICSMFSEKGAINVVLWSNHSCWTSNCFYLKVTTNLGIRVHVISLICDVHPCTWICLHAGQIEVDKVFSNIGDVFYATCHFWVSHMGQVLRQSRKTREVLDPCLLKAGFLVVRVVLRICDAV